MVHWVINLLFPAYCYVCGKKTDAWNKNLCKSCFGKINKRLPPFCIKCGRQMPGERDLQSLCSDCKKDIPHFNRALSAFYYNGILKGLIHNFKYKKMTSLAREFTDLIEGFMKEHKIGKGIDLILSIPMHTARLFKREINPSHILAEEIAKRLGLPYSNKLLKKTKNTPPQSKLSRAKRIKNIKGTIIVQKNKEDCVKNKHILLIDDLFTTGSTVNECARILKEAGANYVEVLTLARGDKIP